MDENAELQEKNSELEAHIERLTEARMEEIANLEKAKERALRLEVAGRQSLEAAKGISEASVNLFSQVELSKGQAITALHIIECAKILNEAETEFNKAAENQ